MGPLLFVIYINDLPDGLENVFKMYADDSKVIAEVCEDGCNLQRDIVRIKEWCDKWSMCLNAGKCKIMHFGSKNPNIEYYIDKGNERVVLGVTEAEKDLGVIITNNCKNKQQAEKAINRANCELGKLRKTFKFFNAEIFKILYPTFVRPHLEYASSVWNSISMQHEAKLESIQRRATKMVIELRTMGYEERLRTLGLTTLEARRKRADLIQTYKIINRVEEVDINMGTGNNLRRGGVNPGRRHGHQIEVEKWGYNPMRNNSLPNRTATTWNILPSEVVMADTTKVFKSRVDEHMRSQSWRRSIYNP